MRSDRDQMKGKMLDAIYQSVVEGNAAEVIGGFQKALEAENDPGDILNRAMVAAMAEVGRRFEAQEYYVPEMLIAARAMKEGLAILKPYLLEADIQPVGKVVLATVQGDLHDIGKNLVGMMLEGAGFEVIDLGIDISEKQFVEAVREHQPKFVGMSALLTTTMPRMRTTIEAIQEAGLRDQVVVMVGGAPVTQEYADEIRADIYAPSASTVASRANSLINTT